MSSISEKIAKSVDRIAVSREYVERKLSLAPGTHQCTYDAQGRCLYCPAKTQLRANGRTGELTNA